MHTSDIFYDGDEIVSASPGDYRKGVSCWSCSGDSLVLRVGVTLHCRHIWRGDGVGQAIFATIVTSPRPPFPDSEIFSPTLLPLTNTMNLDPLPATAYNCIPLLESISRPSQRSCVIAIAAACLSATTYIGKRALRWRKCAR